MSKYIFLVEIGIEECPSKMLRKCGELFSEGVQNEFNKMNVVYDQVYWFASSRRLALQVVNISFNLKIDNSNYIGKELCVDQYNKNINSCSNESFLNCKDVTSLLIFVLNNALSALPISMMMRWGMRNVKFIRPVRSISVLLDDKLVLCNFFGLTSSRMIRGHRFMGKQKIFLDHAKNYEKILSESGFVIVNYEYRKNLIRDGIESIVNKIGGICDYPDSLLEEVTALSEWPVVLFGSFKERFLSVPYEILLYIMIVKKKYFPIYDFNKRLLPYFIFIVDVNTDKFRDIVISHERILHFCFSDAEFFLNVDRKHRLEDYLFRLRSVLFHRKLGSLYDKTIRMKVLSGWMASTIGVSVSQVERAAILSKCDLLSHMVFEFPFAQGIIGMYYAFRDGESQEVALAQKEQYQPKFFVDTLPSIHVSCIIAIADKIDTISGMFILKKYPKGCGDPLGLRRAAMGILRIMIEKKINISLVDLVEYSLNLYKDFSITGCVSKIIVFLYKRLCFLYERKGYKIDVIQITLSKNLHGLSTFNQRVKAVNDFFLLKEFKLFFLMYKRIFNILKNISHFYKEDIIKCSLLIVKEEIILAEKLMILRRELVSLCEKDRYYDGLILLTTLCVPVENFFNNVVVMSESNEHRLNRLVLLKILWFLLLKIMHTPSRMFERGNRMNEEVY